MGMDAEIIAIGEFSEAVIHMLEYSAECYEDTKEGALVVVSLFACPTTEQSNRLAEAFNIDPWDFNQHELKGLDSIDEQALKSFNEFDLGRFRQLKKAGFVFFYIPNG